MPVTEFVTFRFKALYSLNNEEVRGNFRKLSLEQSEWSKYPLTFYSAIDDPGIVCLVSGWKDVPEHMKWIESDTNQKLLQIFDPIISIVDFAHLEIDFTQIPSDTELLVYQKGDYDNAVEWFGRHEGYKLWSGEGKGDDGSQNHCLRAYRNIELLETGSLLDNQWKILRRIVL